jgi:hypothetical protein
MSISVTLRQAVSAFQNVQNCLGQDHWIVSDVHIPVGVHAVIPATKLCSLSCSGPVMEIKIMFSVNYLLF